MKTKEEIERLAEKEYNSLTEYEQMHNQKIIVKDAFIDGYTRCQEDMAKNYTEREVVIMLQDCAIHFGIMNKYKDDGTFTTQIDKWVKNKLNKQD